MIARNIGLGLVLMVYLPVMIGAVFSLPLGQANYGAMVIQVLTGIALILWGNGRKTP